MVDQAAFMLARTSYKSRCWLNTYWKESFWPHEFKIVKCLKRYVDIWKRFICYVLRVQHFEPYQRQDIYNIRLGRDETIMMRHILYLVTRLQRDSANYDENRNEGCEGDEDEPSDCDDEDEDEDDEEDNHGIDEECFKEYNRLETETHSNGNKGALRYE
ncbi:hypothetical protein FOTG_16432 [Fusarium oxysporum f. sp. vasinfectum 25433]|uniref:Uncharacterized protein n=1 Tax=Fusarium oxysporum f. sp. vasinfectum 25433 TaxID=1089449 RepID=X0L2E8_FUSOX|nr:hypothetical protein FOTG_16432 [Fusarium oxysporum f. sp. vasinfectum 25433]